MNTKLTSKSRRIIAIAAAAIAVFAIAPGAASAKPKVVHADVSVWMNYQPAGNGVAKAFIFGGVDSTAGACENTDIYIGQQRNNDPNTWDYVWGFQHVTHQDPGFTRYLEPSETGNVQYAAWTGKQVIKKKNKKIVCDYGNDPNLLYAN